MSRIYLQIKFSPKIDTPSSITDFTSLKVKIKHDSFSVSVLEFSQGFIIHWHLNLHTFYHILPGTSNWALEAGGRLTIELDKGIKIAWRNVHFQATVIYPNQHIWWEILSKYSDELEGDLYIFDKAEKRIEEEEDKKNLKEEMSSFDSKYAKELRKEY